MKINKFFIPVISAAFLLSGCSMISNLIKGGGKNAEGSKPTFQEKGESVTKSQFINRYSQSMENANLVFGSGHHFASFVAKIDASTTYNSTQNRHDRVYSETKETNTSSQKMEYDSESKVAAFERNIKTTDKNKYDEYTLDTKTTSKYKGGYQLGEGRVLYVNDVVKTYQIYDMDYDSYEEEYWMDRVLYGQMYSQINLMSNWLADDNAKYYINGEVLTLVVENEYEQSSSEYVDYRSVTNNAITIQMDFKDGTDGVSLKYANEYTTKRNYERDSSYGSYSVGDKDEIEEKNYMTAKIEFKSVSKKAKDLSGYTKL